MATHGKTQETEPGPATRSFPLGIASKSTVPRRVPSLKTTFWRADRPFQVCLVDLGLCITGYNLSFCHSCSLLNLLNRWLRSWTKPLVFGMVQKCYARVVFGQYSQVRVREFQPSSMSRPLEDASAATAAATSPRVTKKKTVSSHQSQQGDFCWMLLEKARKEHSPPPSPPPLPLFPTQNPGNPTRRHTINPSRLKKKRKKRKPVTWAAVSSACTGRWRHNPETGCPPA